MTKYEVQNRYSAHSFGIYEADSAESAIAMVLKEAGYGYLANSDIVRYHPHLIAAEVVETPNNG